MNKVLLFMLMLFLAKTANSQDYYYYKDEKQSLTIMTDRIFIKFNNKLSFEKKQEIIKMDFTFKPFIDDKNNTDYSLVEVENGKTLIQIKEAISKLNKNNNIVIANPFFSNNENAFATITDEFIVKIKITTNKKDFFDLLKTTNTKLVKQDLYNSNIFVLSADKNSMGNALKMANYFYETGKFEWSHPDFLIFTKLLSNNSIVEEIPNDPFFPNQWYLEKILALKAWQMTKGNPNIKIAIIDNGIDLEHEDLKDNLLPGHTSLNGNYIPGSYLAGSAHGTACAGIIAAIGNNNKGIAGIAYDCKIIPIASNFYNYSGIYISDVVDAFNWATNNDADIISCSWGDKVFKCDDMDNAINNALDNGRNGLGCVLLFSTGNYGTQPGFLRFVQYPAYLPRVIAVGATDQNDMKTDYSSWGGQRGVNVVAPGNNIYTTDNTGSGGFTSGDYNSDFNGTSASCPLTAGVVGLILSINPTLTQLEVKRILELSCDKVGGYCYTRYTNKSNGTWNEQMGYGRINAYNAVRYAFNSHIYSNYVVGGTDMGATTSDVYKLTIIEGCSLAAGVYFVYKHPVEKWVNFSETPFPQIICETNGLGGGNPILGNTFVDISYVTTTSAKFTTYVYETFNILGQNLGFMPTSPDRIFFDYTVLSNYLPNIYLQNQEDFGTQSYLALNSITAGYNVTNELPMGNYVIKNGSNITLHAGNSIEFSDGFIMEDGATLNANIDPFFSYKRFFYKQPIPFSNFIENDLFQNYETSKLLDTLKIEKNYIKNFPNPFTNSTTIEYHILESNQVKITITDVLGKSIFEFINKKPFDSGTYQINIDGIKLPPGVYYYKIVTDNYKETNKMIKK